ncbi:MAG: hypothetical protein B6D46_07355 [Polyangiaceae bacterium UTPRO1]|jgi:SAM-dependent methyltransferase|nr:MAG: hypothetical protein B6D46_07355 [Polyangiaceae bacterium UTPRO1]
MAADTTTGEDLRQAVRRRYGAVAASTTAPPAAAGLARTLGYSDQDLAAVPEGANLGLGCGNPVALASLRPGDVVLDLGSGAGFDALLAARAVGKTGRVIGVDMTEEMVAKARANAVKAGLAHGERPRRRPRGRASGRLSYRRRSRWCRWRCP